MEQKLITIDLDGTTLNSNAEMSSKTKEVLQKASAEGHIVSIITGRPYRISEHYYDNLGIKTPMINFNGALGHLPHQQWNKEYTDTFSRDIVLELLKHKEDLGIKILAAEGKNMVLSDLQTNNISEFFPRSLREDQILNSKNLQSDPSAVTMLVEPNRKQELVNTLNQQFGDLVHVGVWGGSAPILELSPVGIDKVRGLKFLADNFNIDRKNIIAFGDEHNDVTMLDYAGWGVAMQNASDAAKKAANDVTPLTNDQDGVAKYLEKHLKLS